LFEYKWVDKSAVDSLAPKQRLKYLIDLAASATIDKTTNPELNAIFGGHSTDQLESSRRYSGKNNWKNGWALSDCKTKHNTSAVAAADIQS
jgi:hypothetical protein